MAISGFSSSNRIRYSLATSVTYPITLASWVYEASNSNGPALLTVWLDRNNRALLRVTSSGIRVTFALNDEDAGSTRTAGQWNHLCVAADSATSRRVYINGALITTHTASISMPNNMHTVAIGRGLLDGSDDTSWDVLTSGYVAEQAVWSSALTGDQVASLAKGFSPRRVKIKTLLHYTPLIRAMNDTAKGNISTTAGSLTVQNHPRII